VQRKKKTKILHVIRSCKGVRSGPVNQDVIEDDIMKPVNSSEVHKLNCIFRNLHKKVKYLVEAATSLSSMS
jgi:hypothetical protein